MLSCADGSIHPQVRTRIAGWITTVRRCPARWSSLPRLPCWCAVTSICSRRRASGSGTINSRRSFGLPHSRALVLHLERDRAANERQYDVLIDFPITAREQPRYGAGFAGAEPFPELAASLMRSWRCGCRDRRRRARAGADARLRRCGRPCAQACRGAVAGRVSATGAAVVQVVGPPAAQFGREANAVPARRSRYSTGARP